jgi:hypothetical protein
MKDPKRASARSASSPSAVKSARSANVKYEPWLPLKAAKFGVKPERSEFVGQLPAKNPWPSLVVPGPLPMSSGVQTMPGDHLHIVSTTTRTPCSSSARD